MNGIYVAQTRSWPRQGQMRECRGKVGGQRRFDRQCVARNGMRQGHRPAMKQQTIAAEPVAEQTIVAPIAVGGIAHNGMEDVFHVATQLVFASGPGFEFQQAVAGAGVTTDREGEFGLSERAVIGDCRLCRFVIPGLGVGDRVQDFPKGIVDMAFRIRPAAYHRKIVFADTMALEQRTGKPRGVGIQREQQYA